MALKGLMCVRNKTKNGVNYWNGEEYLKRKSCILSTTEEDRFMRALSEHSHFISSDEFTHRLWPRALRNTFPWRLIIDLKFAKLHRGKLYNLLWKERKCKCLDQWFSKFFDIPPLQTQTLSIPPQKRSRMIIAKISHYLLWRNNRRLWTKQTLIISVTTVEAASTCKLLRLLLGRCLDHLTMELIGNRSCTLATGNGKRSRLRRLKNGVTQGSVLAPFSSTFASLTCQPPSPESMHMPRT